MKKRNLIITVIITAVIGSGLVFAGARNCEYSGKAHAGHDGKHKMERIIGKMDRHLDLSDAQELSLKKILEENRSMIRATRHADKSFYLNMMALGLLSDDFDESVNALAQERAEQVKQGAMGIAHVAKQVSEVLTEEQKQEAHDFIQKRMDAGHTETTM